MTLEQNFFESYFNEIAKKINISLQQKALLRDIFSKIDASILKKSLKDFCKSHSINEDKLYYYFRELIFEDISTQYLKNRFNLGAIHEKKGVSPSNYIAQFSIWVDSISDIIKEVTPFDYIQDIFTVLFKNILLDIAICVEAYQLMHEQRYEKIFDSMKDAIALINLKDKSIHMANVRLSQLLGIAKEDLLKKRFSDICSIDIDVMLKGEQKDIYLMAQNEKIPAIVYTQECKLRGEKYIICIFKDIREEIRNKKEIESLERLYNTLSAINILVTTVEDIQSLFKEVTKVLKEKGLFKYAGIFKKGDDSPIIERGASLRGTSHICIPFKDNRDEYILEVAPSKELIFTEKEKSLLEEIVHDISYALSKIKKHEKLSHLAYYDNITHLPNRTYFFQRLKELINRTRGKVSKIVVIAIIIDKFNELKHTIGNHWMNEIVKSVGVNIKSRARSRDLIARIGEDRFAIAIESINPEPVIKNITNRIKALFQNPVYFNNDELIITLSFGIARFPYDAQDAEELISKAVLSVERAKELGGNTIVSYSEKLTKTFENKVFIRTNLRKAIKSKEFVLYYQPKIELNTGKLKGAEALIRWIREDKVIPPYKFIPILEEGNLIQDVGKWVIEEACEQIRKWRQRGIEINVSVNISPLQLTDISSIEEVLTCIISCGSPNLEVEITESALMEDISKSISFLNKLSDIKIKAYIDDFGTGYSSLAYLKRLPVYGIKIDREFVKDIPKNKDDIEIIKAIVTLAKVYNMKTIAEGPETVQQISILKDLGCDFAQGYYFSIPLPANEFEIFVKNFQKA